MRMLSKQKVNMATLRSQGGDDKNLNLINNTKNDKNYINGESNHYKNGYKNKYANGRIEKIVDEIEEETLEDAHELRESFETPPFITICLIYFGFYILMLLGVVNNLIFKPKCAKEKNRDGYPRLFEKFTEFYSHYVYRRVRDCWEKPICSVPGATVTLKDRVTKDQGWSFEFTNTETECLNLGSYNYLGFAENSGICADAAIKSIQDYGLAFGTSRNEYGTCPLHLELEKLTAEFLGVEDATTCGMGFATNALNIPTLLSPGCLVLSDEKNHASLILGLRLSGATIRVFKHNNMKHLEKMLQEAIVKGQPKCEKHTPWRKIFIFVEGIYSMEGSIVNLPKVIALKKKYKAYLYLDEAHSIGALGKHGRGVVDYFNCNPKDVDILMGTYTKSFGSAGGYIAGSKSLISQIRSTSHAQNTASAMSPPVAAQIISVMKIMMGREGGNEGQKRIEQLARNTRYFRRRVAQMGLITYGHEDSPVVPILVYLFSKIGTVVRRLQEMKIATVGVGFPATPLMQGRIRICLSAAHTKEQLDYALDCLNIIADEAGIKYSRKPRDPNPIIYEEGLLNIYTTSDQFGPLAPDVPRRDVLPERVESGIFIIVLCTVYNKIALFLMRGGPQVQGAV